MGQGPLARAKALMDEETRQQHAEDLFGQAYQTQMDGDLDKAADLYRQSIALNPTAEAHTFLGWTYSEQGHLDEAIGECHEAIRLDPDYGKSLQRYWRLPDAEGRGG